MAKRWQPKHEKDEVVFAACDRFLAEIGRLFGQEKDAASGTSGAGCEAGGRSEKAKARSAEKAKAGQKHKGPATLAAEWLQEKLKRPDLKRQQIYPLFWEAVRREYVKLMPPQQKELAKNVAYKYGIGRYDVDEDVVQVVNVRGAAAHEHVANVGAELLLKLIKDVAQKKKAKAKKKQAEKPTGNLQTVPPVVHVGLSAGVAAMTVAKRLGTMLRIDRGCPNLVFHAISTGGFSIEEPTRAPSTYFRFFDDALKAVKCVGLFCPTVVACEDYEKLKETPGVRTSFRRASEVDIVITSLASARDPHGLLVRFLNDVTDDAKKEKGEKHGRAARDAREHLKNLEEAGWVGEMQFRPFGPDGPIQMERGIRAVTLFEMEDFKRMAEQPDKHVVLLAGPCRTCLRTKTDALWYLLTQPSLRVWSHLILDVQTARELLAQPAQPGAVPHFSDE